MGTFEHVYHAHNFIVLTDDTQTVIYWLAVHTAKDPQSRKLRTNIPPDHELEQYNQITH